jgi:TPR repeat protein
MHDHDQAADWYRKAAEQGGKTELKRLGDSL